VLDGANVCFDLKSKTQMRWISWSPP